MSKKLLLTVQKWLNYTRHLDFLAPLALRIYLVPIFWVSGLEKLRHIETVSLWFGQDLGLPYPTLMAYLAGLSEFIGAIGLALGLLTRWISVPLMVVMSIAAWTVHWQYGWLAIAARDDTASIRLNNFLGWLQNHFPGRYQFITELGQPVILNNGIEFAATYFIMLLCLFFYGAGRYISCDYWVDRWLTKSTS